PEGRAYLYEVYSPPATGKGSLFDSSVLHVYDVLTGRDRVLWSFQGPINATWSRDGIHAETSAPDGTSRKSWLVDPASGHVTAAPALAPFGPVSLEIRNTYRMTHGGGGEGVDGSGRPILLDGSRNPRDHYEYFVGGPDGKRLVIHSGTVGDSFDF